MEVVGRLDARGRLTIPKEIREEARLGDLVRIRLEGGRVVIEPLEARPIRRARFKVTSLDLPRVRRELTELAEDLAGSG